MKKVYKIATLGTSGLFLLLWANEVFRWDMLDIRGGEDLLLALLIGSIAIWGAAIGWQWVGHEPDPDRQRWKMPRWLNILLMVILVMVASAAGRILFR